MIPYPVERSTSWTPPPKKKSSGRFPPPSSPSEDFEEFVHISPTHLSTELNGLPTSPLKHFAQKVFPSLRPARAQDFEERALQAREDDARRGRAFRHAEGVDERAEGWRREERELAEAGRGRMYVEKTHDHHHQILEPSPARRSRSPRLRAHQPLQHPDFLAPPLTRPSIRPVQPQARPHSSYHSDLVPITQPSSRSGHFHVDSSSNSHCSSSPSLRNQTQNDDGPQHLPTRRASRHNDQHYHHPRPTRHSGDLKHREYVVRKRDLLAHPVEAIRQGRVRRGGGEEVFGSEEESSGDAGSFVREVERNRITPYIYDLERGAAHQYEEGEERTPALSMSSSRSPSFDSFGEMFGRLREEKGEEIGETWFRFSKDGHVEVDSQPKLLSPLIVERSGSRASRSPSREINFRDVSRAPPLIHRSSSSSPTPHIGSRPTLPRSAHSFPSAPPIWERQSFNPPTSISDSHLSSSLTYDHLGRPIKLSTPSPLSRTVSPSPPTRTPTSALAANLNQAALSAFDDWEHISSPLEEKKSFVGIGKLGVESEEWEKRGRWVGWKQRGDWVDWASKKKEKKEERKQRWCRRSEEFVYDY